MYTGPGEPVAAGVDQPVLIPLIRRERSRASSGALSGLRGNSSRALERRDYPETVQGQALAVVSEAVGYEDQTVELAELIPQRLQRGRRIFRARAGKPQQGQQGGHQQEYPGGRAPVGAGQARIRR